VNLQDIRDMYDYNDWANRRLLAMTEKVTPTQFIAPSSHSFSSLQATLVHILDNEWQSRLLLQGLPFGPEMKAVDFPTLAAIQQRWHKEDQTIRAYLDGLHDEDLMRIVRYQGDAGVIRERLVWHVLFDVINHGMQHRSEAAVLLTDYGQSPGDIDFAIFLNERKALQEQGDE
jgi:uncharacterized damage-inducible protein DinB